MERRNLKIGWALAIVVAVAGATGVAWAAIPSSDGTIHGCYDSSGALRVIDPGAGATCTSGKETALTWNQTGPLGPAGPPGRTGATGATGEEGPAGPSSVYYRNEGTSFHDISTDPRVLSLPLPAGTYAVTAKAELLGWDAAQMECLLKAPNALGGYSVLDAVNGNVFPPQHSRLGPGFLANVPLQSDLTLGSADAVSLICLNDDRRPGTQLSVSEMSVMAIKVGSVGHIVLPTSVTTLPHNVADQRIHGGFAFPPRLRTIPGRNKPGH